MTVLFTASGEELEQVAQVGAQDREETIHREQHIAL